MSQFATGFPGLRRDEARGKLWADTSAGGFGRELERFYEAYLGGDLEPFALEAEEAPGFYLFAERVAAGEIGGDAVALKGHVTGPFTMALSLLDQEGRAVLHSPQLADAIVKLVTLKARWQVERLRAAAPGLPVIVFLDEPYLTTYGSAQSTLSAEDVVSTISEVAQALTVDGVEVGVHCCGRTDWSLLLATPLSILNFDAYEYAGTVALYPREVEAFLQRGGYLAWGVVPSSLPTPEAVEKETLDSLAERLEDGIRGLVRAGTSEALVRNQLLVTPSCGTAGMRPELAAKSLSLATALAERLRG